MTINPIGPGLIMISEWPQLFLIRCLETPGPACQGANIRLRKYTSHTSHLAGIQKYSEIQSGAGGVTRLCITEYTAHRAPT